MTIAFFSNFLNHHQVHVADELYQLTNGKYIFVEVMEMPEWLKKSGYTDLSTRPYVLQGWRNNVSRQQALKLALEADVALFSGAEVFEYEKYRVLKTNKLTFDVSERWLKRGIFNLLSPRIFRQFATYHLYGWKHKPIYKLCSSAFASSDQGRLLTYLDKCYKWGYFTKVDSGFDVETSIMDASTSEITPLMWCSRFLTLKHPELPVQLAHSLKALGYKFRIDMYGSGDLLDKMKNLSVELDVTDVVSFRGNVPNEQILSEMRNHEIFLFTSDRNEGWGAVANESMSNGCVLVGSNEIGSIPFLVKDGMTGLIFESENLDSLVMKLKCLLDNPELRLEIRRNAVKHMKTIWSPKVAAQNLLTLIDDLQNGRDTSIKEGPCSKAY